MLPLNDIEDNENMANMVELGAAEFLDPKDV